MQPLLGFVGHHMADQIFHLEIRFYPFPNACYNYRKVGHYAEDCPSPKKLDSSRIPIKERTKEGKNNLDPTLQTLLPKSMMHF